MGCPLFSALFYRLGNWTFENLKNSSSVGFSTDLSSCLLNLTLGFFSLPATSTGSQCLSQCAVFLAGEEELPRTPLLCLFSIRDVRGSGCVTQHTNSVDLKVVHVPIV